MSFTVFISTIGNGGKDTFDRAIVERAFKSIAVDQRGDYWNLRTPDGKIGFATISVEDQPKITGLSADRPPSFAGFPKFWDAMFEILAQTRTMLFWPTEGPHPIYCVADPALIQDLSADVIAALGQPAVVSSGAEIDAAIALTGH